MGRMLAAREVRGLVIGCAVFGLIAGCDKEKPRSTPAAPTVTVATPVEREVVDYDVFSGTFQSVDKVQVCARVRGYLDFIGFKDGDMVTKGQVLFQIDPRPFDNELKAAQAQREQFVARAAKADADVKRYKDLVPKGAATAQDLDKAIAEAAEALAGINAADATIAQAKLNLSFARITSPMDGQASSAALSVGNLVGAVGGEQVLTTIVSIDPIYVRFDVDERTLQRIRKAAIAMRGDKPEPKAIREYNLPCEFGLSSEKGFGHRGVVDFVDNQVNKTTGTIEVRGVAQNRERLFRDGYYARVRVATQAPYRAVLVSERAIGTQQGRKYVLLVDDANKVVFRPVDLGPLQEDGLRVIASGVGPKDRVIVNGIQRARPGVVVDPQQEAMPAEVASRPTTGADAR